MDNTRLSSGGCVERVPDFKFLGVHVEEYLTSGVHTTVVISKSLRTLTNNHLDQKLLSTVATNRDCVDCGKSVLCHVSNIIVCESKIGFIALFYKH